MTHHQHLQHPDIQDDMWTQIDDIIAANRNVPGSVIGVLRECQDVVGYLPVELIDYISNGLNLSRSEVYGVASFYSLFSFEPKGRHVIRVCMGTACYVKGIKEAVNRIENKYGMKEGGTSEDRTSARFFTDDFDDLLALFVAQADKLAHAAVRVEAGHALVTEPADDAAQFVFVDTSFGIVGDDVGGENSFKWWLHGAPAASESESDVLRTE